MREIDLLNTVDGFRPAVLLGCGSPDVQKINSEFLSCLTNVPIQAVYPYNHLDQIISMVEV
jgi:hypothetical protein